MKSENQDQQFVVGGALLVALIALIALARFIPVILLSVVPGFLLAFTLERGSASRRLVGYTATFVLFLYVFAILFGVPYWTIQVLTKKTYYGILALDLIQDLTVSIAQWWNQWFLGIGKILKGAARDNTIMKVTVENVQSYLYKIPVASVLLSFLFTLVRWFKGVIGLRSKNAFEPSTPGNSIGERLGCRICLRFQHYRCLYTSGVFAQRNCLPT